MRSNAGKPNLLAGVVVLGVGAGIAWLLLKPKSASGSSLTPWERGAADAPHPSYDAGGTVSSW